MKIKYIKGNRNFGYKILQWQITQGCNYNCYYCIVDAPKKEVKYCTNYVDIIKYLNDTLPKYNILTIPRLWGGEPTIHPYIDEIVSLFKIPFGIYTNMSQSIDVYENYIKLNPLLQYWYCSLHYHEITNLDEYINKMDMLYEKCLNNKIVNVHLNIMLEKDDRLEILVPLLMSKYGDAFRVCVKVLDKIDYNNNYYFDKYTKFLKNDQYYQYNDQVINRFDIVKSKINYKFEDVLTENRVICDINKYFNRMDMEGNIYSCMDDRTFICSIYDNKDYTKLDKNLLCQNRMCCPYLFEYGNKKSI